jgi:DNA polymerase III subunit alpha
MKYAHLHVHSQYSILNSTLSLKSLVERAKRLEMSALSITDEGNLYGAIDFYRECQKASIKPIIGCELYLSPNSRLEKKKIPGTPAGFPLICLAKNSKGYKNLCKLSSIGHLEGFYYTPRIDKETLYNHSEGLICLSGPLTGLIPHLIIQEKTPLLFEEIQWFKNVFKENYYFELQRHPMSEKEIRLDEMHQEEWLLQGYHDYIRNQEIVIEMLTALGKQFSIRCVATNGVHYLERQDWKALEILTNIQSGEPYEIWDKDSLGNLKGKISNPKRKAYFTHQHHFKTQEEMSLLFTSHPDAIAASVDIANEIDLQLDFKTRYYPVFTPPENLSKEDFLRNLCNENIKKRYTPSAIAKVQEKYTNKKPLDVIQNRLSYELDTIISKEMCDYILIVYDFISWAKGKKIAVGPGRGSGVGSIVLYLIGITDIEPLRFNLLFERFINPQRPSYPDIDVDICMDRRNEVIEYTMQKYGKDNVAQIITFGTMKAKMAIKDVGRVLSVSLPKVNEITKLIPEELGTTIEKALLTNSDLQQKYDSDPEVKMVIDMAQCLEGSIRSTGTHAAGLIICADSLTDHIPVCAHKGSAMVVTQFSMKPVEIVGMLKIDFLGLKTLTSIQKTVNAIEIHHKKTIDWSTIPLDDPATFQLLNEGDLNGLFQIESSGMQELIRKLHIDKFEELIAVLSLYRPGPMEMIPSFIQRKHGKEPIEFEHPLMQTVLAETYGIMVYQEQVMQLASLLAQYTLGEGDVLRRAMGKKDKVEMANQREKFQKGAKQTGIDSSIATAIFDKMEKFADYGFNKSHSAAYAYIAFFTAYLKANYPSDWMAALMTCDRDDVSKLTKLLTDTQKMKIPILPPDINESGKEFTSTPKGIRFAISGIKGVGEGVVDIIIKERERNGYFLSLENFCFRIDTQKIGKKTIQYLIEAGCFDFTDLYRQNMILMLDGLYKASTQKQKETAAGFVDLFQEALSNYIVTESLDTSVISKRQTLQKEKELLGFYITGHPLDEFQPLIKQLTCVSLKTIETLEEETLFRTAFLIEELEIKTSHKTQKKFAIIKIGDGQHRWELPVWSNIFEEKKDIFVENQGCFALLQVDKKESDLKLQCHYIEALDRVDDTSIQTCDATFQRLKLQKKAYNKKKKNLMNKKLQINLNPEKIRMSHIILLKKTIRSHPGTSPIIIEMSNTNRSLGKIYIEERWGVTINKELEKALHDFDFLTFAVFE